MDFISKPKARRVIPNWRYYNNTLQLGELDSLSSDIKNINFYPIDEYINDWIDKKSVHRATDLISSAICNSQKENPFVLEAARYLLYENSQNITNIHRSMSNFILNKDGDFDTRIKQLQLRAMDKLDSVTDVANRIHAFRIIAHANPYNPIVYVDMARAYTTIGELEKAEQLIKLSLHLDPRSRFVARAAARFYIHIGDFDKAAYVILKTGYAKYDPWLMASAISVGMLQGKRSSYIKKGEQMAFSDNLTPFCISELASTLGTIEMEDGYRKTSRNLFSRSLISPNDNSLAQVRWASRSYNLQIDINDSINISNGYEEMSYRLLADGKYEEAMDSVVDWICDMPFSEKSVRLGYDISTILLRDYNLSSKVLEVGLKANPNNKDMLNNRAYINALSNNIEEAQSDMKKLEKICDIYEGGTIPICMIATQGLILYRTGNAEEGRKKYHHAIQMAKELNDEGVVIKAQLNMYREDIIDSDFTDLDTIKAVEELNIPDKFVDLKYLQDEIIRLIEKRNDI